MQSPDVPPGPQDIHMASVRQSSTIEGFYPLSIRSTRLQMEAYTISRAPHLFFVPRE